MPVPDFQSFFKPLLDIAADGQEHSLREARERIAKEMRLSEADLAERLPSGTQAKFDNRVAWTKSYFTAAKVLDGTRRGYFKITERGRDLLKQGDDRIDIRTLNQYPEFVEFHSLQRSKIPGTPYSFPLPCRRFPRWVIWLQDAGRDARHGFSSPPRPVRKSVWCPWNTERVRLHRPTSNPPYQVASAWSWTPSARATLRTVASVCNQRRVAVCRESEWRDAGRSTLDRSVMRLAVQLDELVEEAIAPQRTRPGTGSPHQTRL